jgi:phage terminase large subunit GpA-like protein
MMNANYQPQTIQPYQSDSERFADLLDKRVTRRSGLSMAQFAELCPVTAGPKKGQILSLKDAPYARRPLEVMDPSHICQLAVLMFASQSMKSVIAQIVTGYFVKEIPSEVLYAMADLAGMRKTMNRRLVPLLEGLGVEFITQTESKGSRRTGDTTFTKEGNGFNLDGVTANSSAALASETKRLFVADEAGNWKIEIGNQGNPFYQGWARLKAWLDEKKCLVPSTPTDEDTCFVEFLFKQGTQERWWVPCPKCGNHQILTVRHPDGYGLDYRTKRGVIIEKSVVYVCMHCAKSFTEKKKYEIQQAGEWRQPKEAEPINRYTYSFTLHSINSMFESWLEVASAYEKGLDDPIAKKYYDNHVAGQPHKQTGTRVDSKEVQKNNRGEYPRQTVPDGAIYLTLGGDVQKGADRWQDMSEEDLQKHIEKAKKEGDINERKFPRIEIEILGTGPAYRTWSIDYKIFYGTVNNPYAGAWEQLYSYAADNAAANESGRFGFYREHDRMFFPLRKILIDSGYNPTVTYQFCHRWGATFPSKGDRLLVDKKQDDLHMSHFIRYKRSKTGTGETLFTISTKLYKKSLYTLLKVVRIVGDIQAPGFQDFPREYRARYFEGLTAEEILINGEYDNKGRYNEPTDCRVYSMCGGDIYLDEQVEHWRKYYKAEHNYSDAKLEQINRRFVIEILARKMKIDPAFLLTKSNAA